ncbi:hypothetical protein [Sphingobium sp. YG1]|uniref:hypothetical protein n=1 Tax=Sphingobium sp. YG1 TaxID=2082188 RepID=UPI000DBB33AF|nr:hypothetical protein [Sphingobium sp. YG1]BBC99110.1 hypothetical protein YGS_C1P0366 [Sphingobium sp. YG1]
MSARGNNIVDIGSAIDGAEDAPILADEGDISPFGGHDDDDGLDAPPLPLNCPIRCLGVQDQRAWYLDINGQIIALEMANKHGKNSLIGLFGTKLGWLEKNFPQWSKPKKEYDKAEKRWVVVEESEIVGWDQAAASAAMIVECTRRGIFDPAGRIRGAGAHRGGNDSLIIHLGNTVMRRALRIEGAIAEIEYHPTGLHGDFVYPAAAQLPRPWPEPVGDRVADQVRAIVASWNWKRPLLDPLLVLGGIGCGMIGGALEWRSNIWITGGAGTGKSTLNGKHGFLAGLFAKGALRSADPSAAYIRQRLRNSTIPVFLDELEAEEDPRRNKAILELARISSSGDDAGRGGQDHNSVDFTLQSQFWASSILIPPMEPQDRSRWAICALKPLQGGAKPPPRDAKMLGEMGRQLQRRMVDGWQRWDTTFEAYRDALQAMGHKARACDQFGTLLACADLLLYDALPDQQTIDQIAGMCDVKGLREVADAAEEHELCLSHLRTTMVQSRGGDERQSIGTWVGAAVQEMIDPLITDDKARAYHRRLQELGMKLVTTTDKGAKAWEPTKPGYLAVANTHQALSGIFMGKKWAGGVWSQALGRCPDAIEGVKVKFGISSLTATLVPLDQVIDESEIPSVARWQKVGE